MRRIRPWQKTAFDLLDALRYFNESKPSNIDTLYLPS